MYCNSDTYAIFSHPLHERNGILYHSVLYVESYVVHEPVVVRLYCLQKPWKIFLLPLPKITLQTRVLSLRNGIRSFMAYESHGLRECNVLCFHCG
jgi:hypothetical protein